MGKYSWASNAGKAIMTGIGARIGTKQGPKKGGSRTQTKRKSKKTSSKSENSHSGPGYANYKLKLKNHSSKHVEFKSGKVNYFESSQVIVAGQSGEQAIRNVMALCTAQQQLVSSDPTIVVGGNSPELGFSRLLSLNPSQATTGSTTLNAATNFSTDRLFVNSVHVKMSLTNFTNASVKVELYGFQSKVNSSLTPSVCWDETLEGEGFPFRPSGFNQTAPGVPTGGSVGFVSTPTASFWSPVNQKNFRKQYQMVHKHTTLLPPAGSQELDYAIDMNYMIDIGRLINAAPDLTIDPATWTATNCNDISAVRGSLWFMVVLRGQTIEDNTTVIPPLVPAELCTSAETKVGFVMHKKYTCYPIKNNTNRPQITFGIPQIPFNVLDADQDLINIVDVASNFVENP